MRIVVSLIAFLFPVSVTSAQLLGIFESRGDVGTVLHPGVFEYDAGRRAYSISGSGENMWFASDAFAFAWKKVSGDFTLTADIVFPAAGSEPHRKAVLMIRQSLEADSPYADIARHGDGMTSLQAREVKSGITTEIQSSVTAPSRVRIQKRGSDFYMWVAGENGELEFAGASLLVPMHDPLYVGIGVCSHNKDNVEKAIFSNIDIAPSQPPGAPGQLYSTIETVPLSGDRRVTYVTAGRISAPSFTPDGGAILFRRADHIERVALSGGRPETNFADSVAPLPPPVEQQSPEVKLPRDEYENSYPHPSPDGRQIAFLSRAKDAGSGPEDKEIFLRVMTPADGKVRVLAKFTGGKGSLGEPAWSPDSKRVAFISYQWMR